MDKSIPIPDYFKKIIKEIMDLPEIQDLISNSNNDSKKDKEEHSISKDEDDISTKLWLEDQFKRFPKVKEAVEPYMKTQGKILPPDEYDFMRWFIKEARKTGDHLSVKMEDYHFMKYHEERLKVLNKPARWEGLFTELSNAGYVRSNKEVFYHVMEYKHLPRESDKIEWLTYKADALDVQANFDFSMPEFNQCFKSIDGRQFTLGSRTYSYPHRNKKLSSIIEKYKTPKRG